MLSMKLTEDVAKKNNIIMITKMNDETKIFFMLPSLILILSFMYLISFFVKEYKCNSYFPSLGKKILKKKE